MVDYSKWKDIEISDDEDDTHPNIDTPSLFRWRHQARVERQQQFEIARKEFEKEKENNVKQLKEIREKIENCKDDTLANLQAKLKELELKSKELEKRGEEIRVQEKKSPWNVDTISKPGFAKTIINPKAKQKSDDELTEEEKERKMKDFVKDNEKLLKQFGMLKKFEDSRKFLLDHHQLVGESTANYLVIWCINLEMEKKSELMAHVAHQCICMQFILELAKQLDVDPRACVGTFYQRIELAEAEYKAHFESEVEAFKERIRKRAQEKIDEAIAEQEEEERKQRLGPGGLDPVEVFESLPESLQQCFETRNIELLQQTITQLPEEEARYHLKRCVDSGLWIPDASKVETQNGAEGESSTAATSETSATSTTEASAATSTTEASAATSTTEASAATSAEKPEQ